MNWLREKISGLVARIRWNLWRFNARKLWTDLDSITVDRPIFLLGTQGAGLTLLSRMLQRNRQVVNVWGDAGHWAGPDELHVVMASRLPDSLRLRGHPALKRRGLSDSWIYATDDLLPVFRKTREDADDAAADLVLSIIRELILLHAGPDRHVRFLDKSQSYTLKVGFLEEVLAGYEPHYLLVLRSPYAMCRRAALKPLKGLDRAHLQLVRLATEHWANSYRGALKDGTHLDRFKILRFEDLLAEPERRLRNVCDFLDLAYESEMLPGPDDHRPLGSTPDLKWYPLRPDVNQKYLQSLSAEEIEIIDERCGSLADRFDYTPGGP